MLFGMNWMNLSINMYPMLQPLKLYKSRNEIFTDLDLEETVMQALMDIFEDYGEFEYDEEQKHCYTPKLWKQAITHRLEKEYRGIQFVIWTYSLPSTYH